MILKAMIKLIQQQFQMDQLNTKLTWGLISLQGVLLLIDPETRNHIYNTFSAFNSVSIPFLQSFAENMRYVLSFILIPTFFYPKSWIIPKFASMVAYVFFVCLHSNVIFYSAPTDIKGLLIQLLILGKALMILVDQMIAVQQSSRKSSTLRRVPSASANVVEQKVNQAKIQKEKKIQQISEKEIKSKGKKSKTN